MSQDSFRVRPNLTLNLGLRWDVNQPWYDTQDKIETIVPGLQSTQFPTAPKGWVVPGDPGIARTPRAHRTIIRAASGRGLVAGFFGRHRQADFRRPGQDQYSRRVGPLLHFHRGSAPLLRGRRRALRPVLAQHRSAALRRAVPHPLGRQFAGQRFPFILPTPGDPKNKTLDYSVFLPIQGSPGYDIHNTVPYAEHYNFSIQRQMTRMPPP